jgi:thiol-disulfide isomerase/thioredoxin
MMRTLTITFVLALTIVAGCGRKKPSPAAPAGAKPEAVTNLPKLWDFWATWCGPCKEEMPAMQTLYQKLRDKGFEVVAVDMMEDRAAVAKFVKTAGYTFPVLLDSTGAIGGGAYAARAIPTNYVVDKGGRLVGRKIGIDGPTWTSDERLALFESLLSQ